MSISSSSQYSSSFLAPRTAARLAREVQDLIKTPEPCVKLIVDEATGLPTNLQELTVEMEGPDETPYVGKYYLLRFTFGCDFPNTPPRAHFLTKVYHPNIDVTNGSVCVNTLKRDWKIDHTLRHCLAIIRCLLLQPFPDSALNEDAGKLFMESYNEYFKRAKLHADVHGRPTSMIISPSSPSNTQSNKSNNNTDVRVLQTSSRNTSSSQTRSSVNNIKKSSNSSNKSKMMTKKKSLKRL